MAKPGSIVSGAVAIAACILAAYQTREAAQWRGKVQTLQQQQAPLAEQIERLQRERDAAVQQISTFRDENARRDFNLSELLKLRGEVGVLREENLRLRQNASPEPQSLPGPNEETVNRQKFSIRYDPELWRINRSSSDSMVWDLYTTDGSGSVEVTVTSSPYQKDRDQFKKERLFNLSVMGDPPEYIGERVQTINGREWMVLDYRNARRRPTSSESLYFLPTSEGYLTTYVYGEEASMPKHREKIETFLRQIQIK